MRGETRSTDRRRIAMADGSIYEEEQRAPRKLSRAMAMLLGVLVTLEIMVAGAMILNLDFMRADGIALALSFMVLYSGVVAVLTDK